MSEVAYRLLGDVEPQLASDLEGLLLQAGEAELASRVSQLPIVDRADDAHGSDFYAVPRPAGHWGIGHRTFSLRPGAIHVDVVDEQIVCVEVLRKAKGEGKK